MSQSKHVLQATDAGFQSEIASSKGVAVIDFWAEWCGPCRMLAPTVEALAEELQGKARIYKMNVDENPNTPSQFHVRGIPTLMIFKDGQAVDQLVGNQPRDVIRQAIEKHLA